MSESTGLWTDITPTVGTREFSRDTVLEILSNRRRRFVIHYLKRNRGRSLPLRELSEQVASWENGKRVEELSHKERKRVQTALRQFHLPKMAEADIVEYDARRGVVELTSIAADSNFYVDVLPEREIPWGLFYLGLSMVSVVSLVGVWIGIVPFSTLSSATWMLFFVATLCVSSTYYLYDNCFRARLGARETPLEVKRR